MHKLLEGYQKADSHNIPVVDLHMMTEYIKGDRNFIAPEIRCVRAVRSGRESYGDSAIGYVQIKRNEGRCTVMAAVAPEHNVRSKSYRVQVDINVRNSTISLVRYHDCVASQGGCKHGLALLGWLYRKSESQGVTEIECYWKKSRLSKVGTTLKWIEASSLTRASKDNEESRPRKKTPTGSFLKEVMEDQSMKWNLASHNPNMPTICRYYFHEHLNWFDQLDLHRLFHSYRKTVTATNPSSFKAFLSFCKATMTEAACLKAQDSTSNQSKNPDWFKLRYLYYIVLQNMKSLTFTFKTYKSD